MIFGAIPYKTMKEKAQIIHRLKKEFDNKVRLSYSDTTVEYEHLFLVNK